MAIFEMKNLDEPAYSFELTENTKCEEEEFGNKEKKFTIINFGLISDVFLIKICTEDHDMGISLEYAWLDSHFPGYKTTGQELNSILINENIFPCDILTITKKKDAKKIVFEISDFYENLVSGYNFNDQQPSIGSKDLRTFEVLLDDDINNKQLIDLHKIILCPLSNLKENINNHRPIFITDGAHSSVYEPDCKFLVLLKYLKDNKIKTYIKGNRQDNGMVLKEFLKKEEIKL